MLKTTGAFLFSDFDLLNILSELNSVQNLLMQSWRAESVLNLETPKIEIAGDFERLTDFQVRNSDIDIHQHVNNTRYAQWILDSIPMSWHLSFQLLQYEISFLAETKSNDVLSIMKSKERLPSHHSSFSTVFLGYRASDQKYVFSARLYVNEKS